MAYPGEYRRDELGEDGYDEGAYRDRGYYGAEGYGRPAYGGESYGGSGLPLFGEQYEHHKHHGHHHRPEYLPGGYATEGYGSQQPQVVYVENSGPLEYVQPESSDLGMGLRDSHIVASTDYGPGYGRPELSYGVPGYGPAVYADGKTERLQEELEHERRRRHEAEAAVAAATAYGVHERHEKKKMEELERYEPIPEHKHHHHHFFSED